MTCEKHNWLAFGDSAVAGCPYCKAEALKNRTYVFPHRDYPRFCVGQTVRKTKGYSYDGTVRSAFLTGSNEWRYVVEHDTAIGMLHIFNASQLEARECS